MKERNQKTKPKRSPMSRAPNTDIRTPLWAVCTAFFPSGDKCVTFKCKQGINKEVHNFIGQK